MVFYVWNLICLIIVEIHCRICLWSLMLTSPSSPYPFLTVIPCLLPFVYFRLSDWWSDLRLVCLWIYYGNSLLYPVLRIYVFERSKFWFHFKVIWLVLYRKRGWVVKDETCGLLTNFTISLWISFLKSDVWLIVILDLNKF